MPLTIKYYFATLLDTLVRRFIRRSYARLLSRHNFDVPTIFRVHICVHVHAHGHVHARAHVHVFDHEHLYKKNMKCHNINELSGHGQRQRFGHGHGHGHER
jgi:hypothetical protein